MLIVKYAGFYPEHALSRACFSMVTSRAALLRPDKITPLHRLRLNAEHHRPLRGLGFSCIRKLTSWLGTAEIVVIAR
ncbi:hypothetical protein XH80_19555 [Bradyrhizobium sp. CCBAU 45384]|nr:hypothetical protein [Bradyrhizobium sp. CCBAU 45384]